LVARFGEGIGRVPPSSKNQVGEKKELGLRGRGKSNLTGENDHKKAGVEKKNGRGVKESQTGGEDLKEKRSPRETRQDGGKKKLKRSGSG